MRVSGASRARKRKTFRSGGVKEKRKQRGNRQALKPSVPSLHHSGYETYPPEDPVKRQQERRLFQVRIQRRHVLIIREDPLEKPAYCLFSLSHLSAKGLVTKFAQLSVLILLQQTVQSQRLRIRFFLFYVLSSPAKDPVLQDIKRNHVFQRAFGLDVILVFFLPEPHIRQTQQLIG